MISRRRSAGSADHPSAATSARRSGWRVLTFDSARAARPSSTRRRTSSTFVASRASTSVRSAWGQLARCTEIGSSGWSAKRSVHTRSVMNGVNGAMSRVAVRRQLCSVASAARSPSQKRRRDRRTYQFDKSSMKFDSNRPASWVSKSSSAACTLAMSSLAADNAHRSSEPRSAAAGIRGSVGSNSAMRP